MVLRKTAKEVRGGRVLTRMRQITGGKQPTAAARQESQAMPLPKLQESARQVQAPEWLTEVAWCRIVPATTLNRRS